MDQLNALKPIFRIYQICGFVPFPIPFDMKLGVEKTARHRWLVYNICLIVYLTVLLLLNSMSYNILLEDKSEMIAYMSFLILNSVRCIAVIIVIESILKGQEQIRFFRRIDHIDHIFRNDLGQTIDYKKTFNSVLVWMIIWIIKLIILICLINVDIFIASSRMWEQIMWILYTFPLCITSLKYFQVINYIHILGVRFEYINSILSQIYASKIRLNTSNSLSDSQYRENRTYNDVVSLRRIYHILWESTAQLNNFFQWSLLLLIGISFVIILVNFYRTLIWMINVDAPNSMVIIVEFLWSVAHSFYCFSISNICYRVTQEVQIPFILFMSLILLTKCSFMNLGAKNTNLVALLGLRNNWPRREKLGIAFVTLVMTNRFTNIFLDSGLFPAIIPPTNNFHCIWFLQSGLHISFFSKQIGW